MPPTFFEVILTYFPYSQAEGARLEVCVPDYLQGRISCTVRIHNQKSNAITLSFSKKCIVIVFSTVADSYLLTLFNIFDRHNELLTSFIIKNRIAIARVVHKVRRVVKSHTDCLVL